MSSCWHAMDTPQREPALGYFIHGFSVNGEGRMLMKTWRGVFMPSSSKNNYMQFLQSTSPAVNISGKSEKLHISQLIARREICGHTYTCLKSVLRIRFITFICFFLLNWTDVLLTVIRDTFHLAPPTKVCTTAICLCAAACCSFV